MSDADDIARIIEQEKALVFERFDEAAAFEIGAAVRNLALARDLGIVVDVVTWDRRLFFAATPGSTPSNANWARRKLNLVKMYGKASYRIVLEQGRRPDRLLDPAHGFGADDYVLAGGAFPIRLSSAGAIGGVSVSGLPERDDHKLVVEALCGVLGRDPAALALGPG